MAFVDNLFGAPAGGSAGIKGRTGVNAPAVAASDVTGLFLKKFAGEVMTVFDEKNIMKPLHTLRTITKGKSAQFPIIGTANAGYYTPGSDILAVDATGAGLLGGINSMSQTETLIHIDKLLMSSTFIASIDELVSHFDVRSPYSHQLGEALANQFDKNVITVACLTGSKNGPREDGAGGDTDGIVPSDAFITGQTKQGSVVFAAKETSADNRDLVNTANAAVSGDGTEGSLRDTPNASVIRKALFESARLLDEKDVPQSDRYCILEPKQYYELINNTSGTDIINSSVINKDVGGEGSIAAGTVIRVAGITLLTSNHLPKTALTDPGNSWTGATGNSYVYDATELAGIVFHKGGFGTLKLQDLSMESEYMIQRQGTLFVAKYSMGHGPLRPESVVVWSDGAQE